MNYLSPGGLRFAPSWLLCCDPSGRLFGCSFLEGYSIQHLTSSIFSYRKPSCLVGSEAARNE